MKGRIDTSVRGERDIKVAVRVRLRTRNIELDAGSAQLSTDWTAGSSFDAHDVVGRKTRPSTLPTEPAHVT